MGCRKSLILSGLFLFVIILLSFLFSINFVSGNVLVGNSSGYMDSLYRPSSPVSGWINVSLSNEPINSIVRDNFNHNMTLIDFLKNNSATGYNCTPNDCSYSYDITNPETTKTFSLNRGESKTIGIKITGDVKENPIISATLPTFNFYSSAPESCNEQLRIDVFDDSEPDWVPTVGSGNFGCFDYTGCYNPYANLTERDLSTTADFCEKITVPKTTSLLIGAYINVNGNKTSEMNMKVLDSNLDPITGGTCTIPLITGSSSVSCPVTISLLNDSKIYVCIRASQDNDYTIDTENQPDTCGFYDIENQQNHQDLSWDYSIFAQGGKYAPIGSFLFDDNSFREFDKTKSETFIQSLNSYISYKYDNNCRSGCVIPIVLSAKENQQITLSNLLLKYDTNSGPISENKFYDANKNSAKLNSGYLKLDLGKANFSVPDYVHNYTDRIFIGSNEILEQDIQVSAIPSITGVLPTNPPAQVPVIFRVIMSNSKLNMSYVWNFGDNSSQETTNKNTITHIYPAIGQYALTVNAIGINGNYNKTVYINAVSPKSLINQTISEYEKDIQNTEYQISQLPSWIGSQVENEINISDTKTSLSHLKKDYGGGVIDDDTAVQIMKNLLELKVPTGVFISTDVSPSAFLMNKNAIDTDLLTKLGAGDTSGTKDETYSGINRWIKENLNVSVQLKVYSASYKNRNDEILFSDVNFNLNPVNNVKELFFVINGDSNKIKFSSGTLNPKDETNSVALDLNSLEGSTTIDFLYPGFVDILSPPVYMSPEFRYLPENIKLECNLNQICEKDLDEDYKNCSDCKKPWIMSALILIVILLVVAFIIYIILQEWYKKHYESTLFIDRNQLFNVINFINNSEIRGISKSESYKKLKEMNWNPEQIDYAWKKLHGMRTGMWEIPLFKSAENKNVRDELKKRQEETTGNNPSKGSFKPGPRR
jgi:hypothetical protein